MLAEFKRALARDRTRMTVSGFTALGLVEMTRKRTRESLAHVLCEPCAACGGRGEVKTARTVCYEILREILREARAFNAREFRVLASQPVIDLFQEEESDALAMLSDFIGKPVSMQVEGELYTGAVRHRIVVTMTDICFTPARKLAQLIRARKLSATEVMKAFIAQIERVNPKVNAIVTFLPEDALAAAKKFDRNFKSNKAKPLAGLPIAYKDLVATKGIRTTLGLAGLHGQRADGGSRSSSSGSQAAGAITLGKTNTPEFGAGSHTFNKVFGATRNPYDLSEDLPAAPRAARPSRSPAACCPSPTARTSPRACATRATTATWSASARRPGRVPS